MITALFITALLPEAPNHRYSIGALQLPVGGILPADLLVILFIVSFIIINYKRMELESVYLRPFVLLGLGMTTSTAIAATVHPLPEIAKDIRALVPLTLIILIPSWFNRKDHHELSYYLPIVVMGAAVISASLALIYWVVDPTGTTYGSHSPGQIYYSTSFYGSNFLLAYSIIYYIQDRSLKSAAVVLAAIGVVISILFMSSGTKHVVFYSTTLLMTIIVSTRLISKRLQNVILGSFTALFLVGACVGVGYLFENIPGTNPVNSIIEGNYVRFTQSVYAFEKFLNNPLFGQLPGYQYSLQVETWRRSIGTPMSRPTDGVYLSILADYGFIGLLPLIWLFSKYSRLVISSILDYRNITLHQKTIIFAATATLPTFLVVQPLLTSGFWYSRIQPILLSFLFVTIEIISRRTMIVKSDAQ